MEAVRLVLDRQYGGIVQDTSVAHRLSANADALALAEQHYPETTLVHNRVRQNGIKILPGSSDGFTLLHGVSVLGGDNNFVEGQFYLTYEKRITFEFMIESIKRAGVRPVDTFDKSCLDDRYIEPDGGVLYLNRLGDESYRRVILVSEMKHQGTNTRRQQEGRRRQATGNAIERFGKNLAAIRAFTNYETITPFVLFCWGEDFVDSLTVRSKLVAMNEFYKLNTTYVRKRDGDTTHRSFAPISMWYQESEWTVPDLFVRLLEVANAALTTYIY